MHWPFKQHKTSRDQKLTPYYDEMKKAGACFGVSGGYERPMWYAIKGQKPEYEYSYNHQNWYPAVEYETKNTRKNSKTENRKRTNTYRILAWKNIRF